MCFLLYSTPPPPPIKLKIALGFSLVQRLELQKIWLEEILELIVSFSSHFAANAAISVMVLELSQLKPGSFILRLSSFFLSLSHILEKRKLIKAYTSKMDICC